MTTDPTGTTAWIDNQGDVWTLGTDGLMHSPETRPCPPEYVERKWGPLRPVTAGELPCICLGESLRVGCLRHDPKMYYNGLLGVGGRKSMELTDTGATPQGAVDSAINGALRATINDHGPITRQLIGSATKRVRGAVVPVLRAQWEAEYERPDWLHAVSSRTAEIDRLTADLAAARTKIGRLEVALLRNMKFRRQFRSERNEARQQLDAVRDYVNHSVKCGIWLSRPCDCDLQILLTVAPTDARASCHRQHMRDGAERIGYVSGSVENGRVSTQWEPCPTADAPATKDEETDPELAALLWAKCCDHCGCPPGQRIGHDDTCIHRCNDETDGGE